MEAIFKNLKEVREKRYMSRLALAKKAGISVLTLKRAETTGKIRLESKRRILVALGYQVDAPEALTEKPQETSSSEKKPETEEAAPEEPSQIQETARGTPEEPMSLSAAEDKIMAVLEGHAPEANIEPEQPSEEVLPKSEAPPVNKKASHKAQKPKKPTPKKAKARKKAKK